MSARRPAGVHEAKHVAAGLDLWYQVTCSDEAAASGQTWSKLEAFLAKDDAIKERAVKAGIRKEWIMKE